MSVSQILVKLLLKILSKQFESFRRERVDFLRYLIKQFFPKGKKLKIFFSAILIIVQGSRFYIVVLTRVSPVEDCNLDLYQYSSQSARIWCPYGWCDLCHKILPYCKRDWLLWHYVESSLKCGRRWPCCYHL